jgi:HSP20 family protein
MFMTVSPGVKKTVPVPTVPVGPPSPLFPVAPRDEFEQLIQRLFRALPEYGVPAGARHWGLEVTDEEDAIVVRAEAPGFEPEDFDIQVTEGRLVIRAAMTIEPGTTGGQIPAYARKEYSEVIPLPVGIDPTKVAAKYVHGVLTVTLPKTEQVRPHKVPVTPG